MRRPMMLLFVATMLITFVAACQPKTADETVTDVTAPTAPAVAVVEPTIDIAPVEVPGDLTMPSAPAEVSQYETLEGGLQYAILQEGTGIDAMTGDSVKVHYTGWLEDGTMFDSSLQPGAGEPIVFQLGTGSVIPGWELGILGMKVGEKRQLRIPPDLAYGEAGSGPIPPNSTLIFDVELVGVE